MELRQLRAFVTVFDHGSLSAAAKTLLVSQPALTRQIQQLERECGVLLFERVPSGILPTSSGTALYQHAISLLRMAESARDAARLAGPVREVVEVGLAPGLSSRLLQDLIGAIQRLVPRAYLSLTDTTSTSQLQMIRAGRLDIGFVHEPPPADLLRHHVYEEPFGVALRPGTDHKIVGECPVAALDGMDVLAHSRNQVPFMHAQLVSAAHAAGAFPHWHFANFTENALACLTATGCSGAILSRSTAARLVPGWTWHRLVDPPLVMHTWLVTQQVTRSTVSDVVEAVVGEFETEISSGEIGLDGADGPADRDHEPV